MTADGRAHPPPQLFKEGGCGCASNFDVLLTMPRPILVRIPQRSKWDKKRSFLIQNREIRLNPSLSPFCSSTFLSFFKVFRGEIRPVRPENKHNLNSDNALFLCALRFDHPSYLLLLLQVVRLSSHLLKATTLATDHSYAD